MGVLYALPQTYNFDFNLAFLQDLNLVLKKYHVILTNGFIEKALETFKQMQLAVVKPNSTTFPLLVPK